LTPIDGSQDQLARTMSPPATMGAMEASKAIVSATTAPASQAQRSRAPLACPASNPAPRKGSNAAASKVMGNGSAGEARGAW